MGLKEIRAGDIQSVTAVQVAKTSTGAWDVWDCRSAWTVTFRDQTRLVVKAELSRWPNLPMLTPLSALDTSR
jgi:hypothetical protein